VGDGRRIGPRASVSRSAESQLKCKRIKNAITAEAAFLLVASLATTERAARALRRRRHNAGGEGLYRYAMLQGRL